jgi:hypothetical protein
VNPDGTPVDPSLYEPGVVVVPADPYTVEAGPSVGDNIGWIIFWAVVIMCIARAMSSVMGRK